MKNTKFKGVKSKFAEETNSVFKFGHKIVVNGKLSLLTPCCCEWGDGGMIFNPNELEVTPPQSND